MATKKIVLSDVLKKDLKVVGYLVSFGLGAWISNKLLNNPDLSLIFGAAVDYIVFRIENELKGEGYLKALKK